MDWHVLPLRHGHGHGHGHATVLGQWYPQRVRLSICEAIPILIFARVESRCHHSWPLLRTILRWTDGPCLTERAGKEAIDDQSDLYR